MRARRFALLALLGACAPDFTEPWEVKEPRLLAARVEVEGDPERPRPRLQERFALRHYLALPGPLASPLETRYSMGLALCLGFKAPNGELECRGEQDLAPGLSAVSDTELLLSGIGVDLASLLASLGVAGLPEGIDVNALPELEGLDRLALFGTLCVDGRAERVPGKSVQFDPPSQLFRCVDNAGAPFPDPNPFTISVLLDRGRPIDVERNPSFACDPADLTSACTSGVAVPGEPRVAGPFVFVRPAADDGSHPREVLLWPALEQPPPWEGCAADPNLLQVRAGGEEHTIRLRFDASDRERYQYEIEVNSENTLRDGRESLLISHALSTQGGELTRFFSLLDDPDEGEAEISVGYKPPEARDNSEQRVPENGRLVRFYFTLRDQRGGVDFATRELCVMPGANQE